MIAGLALTLLARLELAASLAVMLVLVLRPLARWALGPQLAYRLWVLPGAAAAASLFPQPVEFLPTHVGGEVAGASVLLGLPASVWLGVWLAGAAVLGAVFFLAEYRYRRLCREGLGGPAVTGVWPRMIVPGDYRERFSDAERAMILRHERAHMARRDTLANLALIALQALSWFNPLAHIAAGRVRFDQDLACDALALESHEVGRRAYGEALFKAHLDRQPSRVACAWAGLVGHPLELRVKLLARRPLTAPRHVAGAAAVGAVVLLTALAVWILAPSNQALFGLF